MLIGEDNTGPMWYLSFTNSEDPSNRLEEERVRRGGTCGLKRVGFVLRVCVCICTCDSSFFVVVLQLHTPISRNRERRKLGNKGMVISEKEKEGRSGV